MNIYTIVTNDKYEFPVKSNIRLAEVAVFLGVAKGTVRNMVFKPRKKSKYKVVVTGKIKPDRQVYMKRYDMTHDRSEYFRQRYLRNKERAVKSGGC